MKKSDERILFCYKLWIKELREVKHPEQWIKTVLAFADNDILNGEYCDNNEFRNRKKMLK